MNNFSWMNHPAIKNIDARKLAILMDLAKEAEGKSQDKLVPLMIKANAQLKTMNLSFTKEENDLLVDILTQDMSPAEKQKVEMIKRMARNMK